MTTPGGIVRTAPRRGPPVTSSSVAPPATVAPTPPATLPPRRATVRSAPAAEPAPAQVSAVEAAAPVPRSETTIRSAPATEPAQAPAAEVATPPPRRVVTRSVPVPGSAQAQAPPPQAAAPSAQIGAVAARTAPVEVKVAPRVAMRIGSRTATRPAAPAASVSRPLVTRPAGAGEARAVVAADQVSLPDLYPPGLELPPFKEMKSLTELVARQLTWADAKLVAQQLVAPLIEAGQPAPYSAVVVGGGLGSLPLALLEGDVAELLIYESDPVQREFMAALLPKDQVTLTSGPYTSLPSELKRWIVYVDTQNPTWAGPVDVATLGSSAALVGVRQGGSEPTIPTTGSAFRVQNVTLGDGSRLLTAQPVARLTGKPLTAPATGSAQGLSDEALHPAAPIPIRAEVKVELKAERQGLGQRASVQMEAAPSAYDDVRPPKLNQPPGRPIPGKNWEQSVKDYVRWLLTDTVLKASRSETKLLPTDTLTLDFLLSDVQMPIWYAAFTHYSWSSKDNYENLEHVGDRYLAALWTQFVFTRFPGIMTPGSATTMGHAYMGGKFHADYADQLGLSSLVRSKLPIDFQTRKNLFESFFGALWTVAERFEETAENPMMASGYLVSQKLLNYLMRNMTPDTRLLHGTPQNQVTEIFTKMGWGVVTREVGRLSGGRVSYSLYLTREASNSLAALGLSSLLESTRLSTVEAEDEPAAKSAAFARALGVLRDLGLTRDFVQEQKLNLDFDTTALQAQREAVQKWGTSHGYRYIYFEQDHLSSAAWPTVKLVGLQDNDRVSSALATGTAARLEDAKLRAIDALLNPT